VAYDLTNQHVEAEKSIRHGLDILEPLVKKNADEIKFAISLAHGYHELARSLQLTDRRQTALEMFPKSVNILEEVLKKEPYHVEARKSLADTHMFRAEVLVGMGRHSEAIEDWKQIVDLSEGQNVAILQSIRAIALARMGEHTRAVHEVQDMIQHLLPSNTCIYNYACVFSICSKTVMQDEQLSKAERSRQAETYQSLAMKHLKVLHDKGFLESGLLAQLRQDVDLDPLREYEDFKRLLDELEEEMKKRPAKGKNGERD
jgi:tetratricopeptide (TPR) repeat protein